MSWSLNIGTIAGTAVRVHITFLLFLGWIFLRELRRRAERRRPGHGLAFMLLLFACVLAHEFGHIFTARAFGVATPDVTLLPIGGVARLERIPEEPCQEFLVAIAGPAGQRRDRVRLVVFAGAPSQHRRSRTRSRARSVSLVDRLAAVNLFLALFNMIPAFPMDGGRVLRALLATRLGFVRATEIAAFDRPGRRLRARLHRTVRQSDADLHRDLRLSRGRLRGARGGDAGDVARRAGQHRDDDAVRDA